jgi:YfiH family protein
MIRHESDGFVYHTFEILGPHPSLRHAVLTGSGPGGTHLDLSLEGGRDARGFGASRAAAEALGLPPPAILGQVHGNRILALKEREEYQPHNLATLRVGYDALIGWPGQSLLVRLADCQGIIIFHPGTKALALVHSGWRGSAQNIIGKTVRLLERGRGADPAGMIACVAPSIGPCCMEFKDWRSQLPDWIEGYARERDHLDFWALSLSQLKEAGVREENIELSGVCNRCQPGFFSYRRGEAARFGLLAGIV